MMRMIFRSLSTRLLNICVASFCRVKQIEKAESVIIDGIRLGLLPDAVTYNTLIDSYGRFVSIDAAYAVLWRMREAGIDPNVVTYNSLIAAATRRRLLSKSLDLFEEMLQAGIHPDVWSYNTLMDCCFKCAQQDGEQVVAMKSASDCEEDFYSYGIPWYELKKHSPAAEPRENQPFSIPVTFDHKPSLPPSYHPLLSKKKKSDVLKSKQSSGSLIPVATYA